MRKVESEFGRWKNKIKKGYSALIAESLLKVKQCETANFFVPSFKTVESLSIVKQRARDMIHNNVSKKNYLVQKSFEEENSENRIKEKKKKKHLETFLLFNVNTQGTTGKQILKQEYINLINKLIDHEMVDLTSITTLSLGKLTKTEIMDIIDLQFLGDNYL